MKSMQALQWDGSKLQLATLPVPEPAPGEVLVRLRKAGICNTDLEIIRGYYPFHGTLGHEFVGEIAESEDKSLIGKRVVSDINNSCSRCPMCLAGHPHHCLDRSALGIKEKDGAFAEYLTTPVENLVLVPDNVPDTQAVFAEPLAAALEIQEQLSLQPEQEIAVVGDGKLGLLISMSLHQAGYAVSLVGHHPERVEKLGLHGMTVYASPPARTFSVVVEATGSPAGFNDALALTAARGTLVLKSTYKEPLSFNPAPLVVNEITLLGSRCGPMAKAIDSMAGGRINPSTMIEDTYPLGKGIDAIDRASEKGTLKILLAFYC